MYFYENWQTLLATLELYKLYGADLMVIPLASVITRLYTILRAYEKDGKVRIKAPVISALFVSIRKYKVSKNASAHSK
jgi:hypothetical protein